MALPSCVVSALSIWVYPPSPPLCEARPVGGGLSYPGSCDTDHPHEFFFPILHLQHKHLKLHLQMPELSRSEGSCRVFLFCLCLCVFEEAALSMSPAGIEGNRMCKVTPPVGSTLFERKLLWFPVFMWPLLPVQGHIVGGERSLIFLSCVASWSQNFLIIPPCSMVFF